MIPQDLHIRKVKFADLPLLEWDGEFLHFRKLYENVYQRTLKHRAVMWMADTKAEALVGQLFIQLNSRRTDLADGSFRAYLFGFRIKPAFQSLGIGGAMLAKAERELAQKHFRRICLNVVRTNERARVFYERHGYRIIGPDPGLWHYEDNEGVWHDLEEPAWRMEKELK